MQPNGNIFLVGVDCRDSWFFGRRRPSFCQRLNVRRMKQRVLTKKSIYAYRSEIDAATYVE